MRVCYVSTYPPDRAELGGSGWVDRRLLAGLRAEGHDVEVVSVTGPPGERTLPIDVEAHQDPRPAGLATTPAPVVRPPASSCGRRASRSDRQAGFPWKSATTRADWSVSPPAC